MKKLTLEDCVFLCMRNGEYWTFWDLQKTIKEKTNTFYGEPTISTAIRNLRKDYARAKYGLNPDMSFEVVVKKRMDNSKGWKYRLIKE